MIIVGKNLIYQGVTWIDISIRYDPKMYLYVLQFSMAWEGYIRKSHELIAGHKKSQTHHWPQTVVNHEICLKYINENTTVVVL